MSHSCFHPLTTMIATRHPVLPLHYVPCRLRGLVPRTWPWNPCRRQRLVPPRHEHILDLSVLSVSSAGCNYSLAIVSELAFWAISFEIRPGFPFTVSF